MSYQGKYSAEPPKGRHRKPSRAAGTKTMSLLLALVLLTGAVTGTLAWLFAKTDNVTNTFVPASVPNTPEEKFDGETKTSIVIRNTGNIDAYVRVKLVTYRVNDKGDHIGGEATIPAFTLGANWFEKDGYYYYTKPVVPNATSGELLDSSIKLQQYTDADGGKQVIEVISESIQSVPTSTVESVWPVTVVNGSLTPKGGSN